MVGPFITRVQRTIDRHHLLGKGDRLIVGVSAGVDSMVLLYVLNTFREPYDLDLIVAHVNHGLRPDESDKEAELVRNESERLGLPFEYGQFDVKAFQKARGLSPQDAARRVRFHFFNDLLRKHSAQRIALGQNADDQVETILLRLMRGSGLKGLKGMLPLREGKVVRPLLEVWRREIASYALENNIPCLVDSSNLKRAYLRNRIRLNLIPLIEREVQPNLKGVILKASAILREEDDYLDRGAEDACQKIIREEPNALSFSSSEFQSLHKAIQWRVVEKMLERVTPVERVAEEGDRPDIDSIYDTLTHPPSSFSLDLPYGFFLEKRYDRVSLGRGKRSPTPLFEVDLVVPGHTFIREIGKEVVSEEIRRSDLEGTFEMPPETALLDYDRLCYPLKMRNFRPGDRFQPLGVQGTQKVKEFFIDHKIPRFERTNIPFLVSGEGIVWVVGYRIDERFKITERTQRILKMQVV
ncbi:MAG: tRNA lysidine(34) synthetase TilS [Deltaproteobacteria bacterium RBG_13_52_11b]|nr:MAG: tRNA lysidine(34) synthetase TilS [Deltaproteobacteria bacterium RBG_13_52_11b]